MTEEKSFPSYLIYYHTQTHTHTHTHTHICIIIIAYKHDLRESIIQVFFFQL